MPCSNCCQISEFSRLLLHSIPQHHLQNVNMLIIMGKERKTEAWYLLKFLFCQILVNFFKSSSIQPAGRALSSHWTIMIVYKNILKFSHNYLSKERLENSQTQSLWNYLSTSQKWVFFLQGAILSKCSGHLLEEKKVPFKWILAGFSHYYRNTFEFVSN